MREVCVRASEVWEGVAKGWDDAFTEASGGALVGISDALRTQEGMISWKIGGHGVVRWREERSPSGSH